jgi:acid stress-induced BolA-like protein IbaG/YrbA
VSPWLSLAVVGTAASWSSAASRCGCSISGYKLRTEPSLGRQSAMSEPTPIRSASYIAAGLPCQHLEVEGDGRHFFATIVSAEFEGLPRVRRHQRVYAALGDRMREQIHALSMKVSLPGRLRHRLAAGGPAHQGPAGDGRRDHASSTATSWRQPANAAPEGRAHHHRHGHRHRHREPDDGRHAWPTAKP